MSLREAGGKKDPARLLVKQLLTLADSPSVPTAEVSDPPSLGDIASERLAAAADAAAANTIAWEESMLSRFTAADLAAE